MKRSFNPFKCAIHRRYDPLRKLERFETFDEAQDRRCYRINVLENGNRRERRLAKKLRRCKKGARCLSYACPICTRRYRRWFSANSLQTFRSYETERLSHVTIISAKHQLGVGELQRHSPRDMTYALTRSMKRSGLGGCLVVGAIDYDLCIQGNDPDLCVWQPHFHLIMADVPTDAYKSFKQRFLKHRNSFVLLPTRKVKIRNRVRQSTYMLKPFHRRQSFFLTLSGHRRKKKQPLKPNHLRELLHHLDQFPITEFLVLQNVRRNGCSFSDMTQSVDGNNTVHTSKTGQRTP